MLRFETIGSYRAGARSGASTTLAAAGAISTFRWSPSTASIVARLRAIEVAALVTTGFTAAQEVGYDIAACSAWSVAPSAGTNLVAHPLRSAQDASRRGAAADLEICTAAVVTKGTVVEGAVLGGDSMWAPAATAGGVIGWQRFTFHESEPGGLLLAANEGVMVRNTVLMAAAGIVRWFVFYQWDEGIVIG